MNLLKVVAQLILFYILFRLVVNFVIPAYRSIKRFKSQFTQMQQHFEQQQRQPHVQQNEPQRKKEKSVTSGEGEYIDFEEVKS